MRVCMQSFFPTISICLRNYCIPNDLMKFYLYGTSSDSEYILRIKCVPCKFRISITQIEVEHSAQFTEENFPSVV